jgi:hypothetical protein
MENNKATAPPASRENSCHHERHLNGIALKVYNLFWRLSKKSKGGSMAITNRRIAKLIGARCDGKRADYITRVKTALVSDGWFEFLGVSKGTKSGAWMGGRYGPFSHSEWAEKKAQKLGHSCCHPYPLQTKVSSSHPGGRVFSSKSRKEGLEARTVISAEARTATLHRACGETRTDLLPGSTRTLRVGKHAHSVDFSTGDLRSRRTVQVTQGVIPPVPPQNAPSPVGDYKGGGFPLPSEPTPQENPRTPANLGEVWAQREREAWKALEPWGVNPDAGDPPFRRQWGGAYYTHKAANGTSWLLAAMDEIVQLRTRRALEVPEWFQEARGRVEKAANAEWEGRKRILAEQNRQLREKYPEAGISQGEQSV